MNKKVKIVNLEEQVLCLNTRKKERNGSQRETTFWVKNVTWEKQLKNFKGEKTNYSEKTKS